MTSHMMTGRVYNKAVPEHKLTLEALWQILWPKFLSWVKETGKVLDDVLKECVEQVISDFVNHKAEEVTKSFEILVDATSSIPGLLGKYDSFQCDNPNFEYWRHYMAMVSICLGFIRTDREGNWELHLEHFAKMLPWFALYDHANYARSGPVYLADTKQLDSTASDVHREFMARQFLIQRSSRKLCQVVMDQSLEHINKVTKVSGE